MNDDLKGYIRYLYSVKKMPISRIAGELGKSRNTIRKVIRNEQQKKKVSRASKIDPFKEQITRLLAEKPYASNQHILEEIRRSGYEGGRSILGTYLLGLRGKDRKGFFNLETLPGWEAQADWASCGTIGCGSYRRKLYLFCMVLSYSRLLHIEFTVSMDQDTFLAGHIHAFERFGGVPQTVVYDNLKSVVSTRYGEHIVLNARFADFAGYYGFEPRVCNVRAAHEKGKVERAIRYVKENFLKHQTLSDLDTLKAQASTWLRHTANLRTHQTTRKVPLECFEKEEKHQLMLLAPLPYDYPVPRPVSARNDCLFQFDSNRYSIPAEYIGESLSFKAYNSEIRVYHQGRVVATHRRCYDKYQTIKDPAHYQALLQQKKKARHTQQIETFKAICPEAESFLEGLMRNQVNVLYHLGKILELEKLFGKTAVAGALAASLKHGAFHWEFIKNIVLKSSSRYQLPASCKLKDQLMDIDIKTRDLNLYDHLYNSGEKGDDHGHKQ